MPNLQPNHSRELDSETEQKFLNQFLEHGWFLALDAERVFVGWGAGEPSSTSQLFAPNFFFESEATAWVPTASCRIFERRELSAFVLSGLRDKVNSAQAFQWVEPSREDFEKQFARIREGMRDRGLAKAVPIVFARATAEIHRQRKLHILANALAQPRHLFPYGFWTPSEGMIGVTPEILFSQENEGAFDTVALAGTRAKGQDEKASALALMNDSKERHEHQLVIDDVATVVNKMGEAQVAETGVVILPTLLHLKTEISAKLSRPRTFAEIAQALHPTPALGLSPRALGFTEMRRWDSREDRRRYGAPFGVRYTDEKGDKKAVEHRHCVVAIRNIQWFTGSSSESPKELHEVLLGSGCGIVPASEVDREWQELQLKRDSVKRMLGV